MQKAPSYKNNIFPLSLRSIRVKLLALAAFLVFILIFSGFNLQRLLNENAHLSNRQADIIAALTDTSNANLQFSRFRWQYLTFLNQPRAGNISDITDSLNSFKDRLNTLGAIQMNEEFVALNNHILTLQDIATSLSTSPQKDKSPEEMTQEALTTLGHIDALLGTTVQKIGTLLRMSANDTLSKTSGLQTIPFIFMLGGLAAVFFSLSVIITNIMIPIKVISGTMTAASQDMSNARNYIIPVTHDNEVGKVTQTLNHFLEEISSGIDRVRQTESMLNHAQRMEMMGRMSGGIAHDFNNMLIVISGNLELIERRVRDQPELVEMVNAALGSVDKGKELTQRILVFSRRQILKPEIININRQIPDILELIRRAVREDMQIETDLANDLWDINADPAQFENVLLNLAINARDAVPGHDGKIRIRTENIIINPGQYKEVEPGSYAKISVTDNGSGIAPDIIEHIFDPFFTTKEPGKGTGLGLSMVYGFTRQSGGYVTVDSAPDEGTTISLFYPRATHKAPTVPKLQKNAAANDDIRGGNESLLIVEDREDVLKYISTTLEQLGYDVATAKNGPSALKQLQERSMLDMLITDVIMPGKMNGEELAGEVNKKFPHAKVLYISGYTHDALVNQGSLKPGVNLLAKPFSGADLAREIRNIFESEV